MDFNDLEFEQMCGPNEDPNYAPDPQEYIDRMLQQGFHMVYTRDKVLLLDLDDFHAIDRFKNNLDRFKWRYNVNRVSEWESKSGNTHVAIELDAPMDFLERLICQAYLGSDPTKEYLSMLRYNTDGGAVSFLAQPPGAKVKSTDYKTDTRSYVQ